MYPPIFQTVAAAGAVTALLGTSPVRFYPFGSAPALVAKPYAVWRTVYGSPENILEGLPGSDTFGIQIDVYAATGASARAVGDALQAAIEPVAYVTAYNGESQDPETKNYNYSFTVDWMKVR
jgi:hypothetical protein